MTDRPMNLYAIIAGFAPNNEVHFILTESNDDAMRDGVFVAAHDACDGYRSVDADVYLIGKATHVSRAKATDAPSEWEWAHPGVEDVTAEHERFMAAFERDHGISDQEYRDEGKLRATVTRELLAPEKCSGCRTSFTADNPADAGDGGRGWFCRRCTEAAAEVF